MTIIATATGKHKMHSDYLIECAKLVPSFNVHPPQPMRPNDLPCNLIDHPASKWAGKVT